LTLSVISVRRQTQSIAITSVFVRPSVTLSACHTGDSCPTTLHYSFSRFDCSSYII